MSVDININTLYNTLSIFSFPPVQKFSILTIIGIYMHILSLLSYDIEQLLKN